MQISVFQQLYPFSSAASTFLNVSSDGSRINAYNGNNVISYLFDGVQYKIDSNTTLPSYVNSTAISSDGLYVIYT